MLDEVALSEDLKGKITRIIKDAKESDDFNVIIQRFTDAIAESVGKYVRAGEVNTTGTATAQTGNIT